jgi:hypothetical protein
MVVADFKLAVREPLSRAFPHSSIEGECRKGGNVNSCKTAAILAVVILANSPRVFAQTASTRRVFVDVAIAADRNPVEDFHGPLANQAFRATVGRTAGHHDWRLEVDIPRWRTSETDRTGPMYCAVESSCGPGYVPSHVHERFELRTTSVAALYAQHLPMLGPIELSLVGGGAVESQLMKYSQQSDVLDSAGRVVSHNAYAHDYPVGAISAVMGVDAQVRLTPRLAVVPQVRYHYWPYPQISIVRPGVAVRWQF